MKLDSLHQKFPVPASHDFALLRLGADFKTGRHRLPFCDERMVPRCLKGVGEMLKDRFFVVMDHRGLAVHQPPRAHHVSAERLDDGLMAETYAQDRDLPG